MQKTSPISTLWLRGAKQPGYRTVPVLQWERIELTWRRIEITERGTSAAEEQNGKNSVKALYLIRLEKDIGDGELRLPHQPVVFLYFQNNIKDKFPETLKFVAIFKHYIITVVTWLYWTNQKSKGKSQVCSNNGGSNRKLIYFQF